MNEIVDAHLNGAQKEIRQLRSAGCRALERLKDYEQQLNTQRTGGDNRADRGENTEAFTALFPKYSDIDEDADSEDDYLDSSPIDEPLEDTDGPAIDDFFAEETKPATDLFHFRYRANNEPAIDDDSAVFLRKNEELLGKLAFSNKKVEALNKQLEDLEEDLRLVPHAERLHTGDEDDLRSDRPGATRNSLSYNGATTRYSATSTPKIRLSGFCTSGLGSWSAKWARPATNCSPKSNSSKH